MCTAWLTLLAVVGVCPPAVLPGQGCAEPPRDPVEGCVVETVGWVADWFTPMPQTCYSPRFGCYPGNGREIHRYPAFHGNYYRRVYNYRQVFEWPWLAEPHEPLSGVVPCVAERAAPPAGRRPTRLVEEVPLPRAEAVSPSPNPFAEKPQND
jgi:hypothetical protein